MIKNFNAILDTLEKEKSNNTVKGDLIRSAFITSTMGVSQIKIREEYLIIMMNKRAKIIYLR